MKLKILIAVNILLIISCQKTNNTETNNMISQGVKSEDQKASVILEDEVLTFEKVT